MNGISNVYASPVGADGRIYVSGRNGATLVLRRSKKLEVLATNKLNDSFSESPALAGKQLFLRGRKFLYCLSEGAKPQAGKSIEEKTRIHRLSTTKRAAYDAFVYVNRIPDKPEKGETADDFSGRIFGRLANQEGRILLKLPTGMDRKSYFGFAGC